MCDFTSTIVSTFCCPYLSRSTPCIRFATRRSNRCLTRPPRFRGPLPFENRRRTRNAVGPFAVGRARVHCFRTCAPPTRRRRQTSPPQSGPSVFFVLFRSRRILVPLTLLLLLSLLLSLLSLSSWPSCRIDGGATHLSDVSYVQRGQAAISQKFRYTPVVWVPTRTPFRGESGGTRRRRPLCAWLWTTSRLSRGHGA